MANLNFLDPTTLRESGAQRTNVNGEAAALDSIRKAHRNGPLVGDPIAFAKAAKGVSASRVRDPNADDAVSKDEDEDDDMDTDGDEDMVLTADERNDLRTRRQGRKDADKKRRSNSDAALKMVKAIHGKGARPEDPDAFIKAGKTRLKYVDSRPSFKAIKESQSNPLTMQKLFGSGNNNHPIDMDAVQRIIEKGREQMRKTAGLSGADWNRMSWPERMAAMGKADSTVRFSTRPSFPPESANSTWTRQLANTGAANNWGDENTQRPATEQVGGFTDSRIGPNDARIRAAVAASGTTSRDRTVAAIQMDWQRKKQQMAASFAARRAARDNDKGTP